MPAWRQGMAVGEWRQIPGSALSSAPRLVAVPGNTGPISKVIAWTGFAIDTRNSTVFSPANGGHRDYSGNEVNSIRLSDDAPRWDERRAATLPSQIVDNSTHYADGRPTSRHSYYGVAYNEIRNRVMVMGGGRWAPSGGTLDTVDAFNASTNDWDAARTFPDIPSPVLMGVMAFVEHKSTGDIYAFGNYNIFRWSSAANAWSMVVGVNGGLYGSEAATAMDSRRNRIFIVGGDPAANEQHVYALGSSAAQRVSLSGGSAGSLFGGGNGMVYEPWLDAFLLRRAGAGATVYRINAQTFAVDVLPTTGGGSIPAGTNGVYRRFLFAPQLGGVVYCPAYESNMWFLRTT